MLLALLGVGFLLDHSVQTLAIALLTSSASRQSFKP